MLKMCKIIETQGENCYYSTKLPKTHSFVVWKNRKINKRGTFIRDRRVVFPDYISSYGIIKKL